MSSPGLRHLPTFVSPDFHNRHGAVTDLAVTERHRLMGELLGYFPDGQVSDLVSSFASYLSPRVPEIFEGELAMRVQQFFEPSHKHPLRGLFELTAFFVSNNKLSKVQIENFLKWVIDQNHTPQLDSFLRIETATTRVFSQHILKAAVSIRNTEFLRSLLLSGVDFQHVIREAIWINDSGFVELLLSRVNVECLSGDSGGRLLLAISDTDNVRVASILVGNGASINFNPYERWARNGTPLYHAVYNGKLEMVRFLLEKGADVNIYCYDQHIPTSIAAAVWNNPDTEIVTLLLKHGADINCSVYGQDLLDYVSLNCRNVYRLILEKTGRTGASVTVGDILDAARRGSRALSEYLARHHGRVSQKQLETALYESINQCDHDIKTTLVLLDSDIDPNGLTLDEPPLLLAAICDEEKAIRVSQHLINAGASVNIPGLLCCVVEGSKFDLLCILLDAEADLNEFGPEALEKAVLEEEIEAVALLLDRGVAINAVGEKLSPLQAAASLKTLDLVQYLLDRDADVNTPACEHAGRTALQAACHSGNFDMVTFLLANEADVNAPPAVSDGVTALEAVMSCRAEAAVKAKLFKLLLDNGAEVSHPNGRLSKGIIHTIVQEGLTDLLEIALKAGADANEMSRGREGRTPLQLAAELGRLDIAHALVAYGALINAPPAYKHGRTAIQAAASSSSPDMELLKFLVDNGADVNAAAGVCGGITAVQGAAIAGSIPVVQYLWGKGADVNGRPAIKEGRTAIEAAAEHGRLDTVQLLLNYGAKGDVVQGKGFKRAIDLAQKNNHSEVARLLRSAQRDMESTLEGVAEMRR
jgi:ankyrin repeat protein